MRMIVQIVLNGVGLLFILLCLIHVSVTYKLHTPNFLQATKAMVSVSVSGSKIFLLLSGIIGIISVPALALFPSLLPPLPILLVLGVSSLAVCAACIPPSILMLGTSQHDSLRLASDLLMTCAPLKLVHLLHSVQAGPLESQVLQTAEYRVSQAWHQAVRKLAVHVPLIILDLRLVSHPVELEFVHIVRSNLYEKTVFILPEDNEIPVLLKICIPEKASLYAVDPDNLREAVRGLAGAWMKQRDGHSLFQLLTMRLYALNAIVRISPITNKYTRAS